MTVMFSRIAVVALLFQASISHANRGENCPAEERLFHRAKELFQRRQFLLSSLHFSELSTSRCNAKLSSRSLFSYAVAMSELGEISESLRTLNELEKASDMEDQYRASFFHAFVIPDYPSKMLRPDDQLVLEVWKKKRDSKVFARLVSSDLISPSMKLQLNSINNELEHLPRKSPLAAGILSGILPGAGQAYVGAFQSAAVSFVLNAIFLATTVELFKHDLRSAGLASGMVFSVTYLGNILNSVDSANLKNTNVYLPTENRLKEVLFPSFQP